MYYDNYPEDREESDDESDDQSDRHPVYDTPVISPDLTNDDEFDKQVIDIMMHTARYQIWKHTLPKSIQPKTQLVPDVVFQDFRENPVIKELLKTHLKDLRNEMNAYLQKAFRGGINPKTLREW